MDYLRLTDVKFFSVTAMQTQEGVFGLTMGLTQSVIAVAESI